MPIEQRAFIGAKPKVLLARRTFVLCYMHISVLQSPLTLIHDEKLGHGPSLITAEKERIETLAELEWTDRAIFASIKRSRGAKHN